MIIKEDNNKRIRKEIDNILSMNNPGNYIKEHIDDFIKIIPELKECIGFNQNNPNHSYDVFEHTIRVINNTPNNLLLRYAALFHDLGKPRTYTEDEKGIGHFYAHPVVSSQIFLNYAQKYKMDTKSIKIINKLILKHDTVLSTKSIKIRNFLLDFGIENIQLLFVLKEADIKAQNKDLINKKLNELNRIKKKYHYVINQKPCLKIKDLEINGYDLVDFGFNSEEISMILNDLLTRVANEELENDKEQLLDYVYTNSRYNNSRK